MPFIVGTDSLGKRHWLQASGYWGESLTATNFTPSLARTFMAEIQQRNLYLDPAERIIPELKDNWS